MSTGTRVPAKRRPPSVPPPVPPASGKVRGGSGRFRFVFACLFLIVAMMVLKLFYLQVIDAHNLKKKAQSSRNQSLALYSRGRILDRNGMTLAQDTILYDLFAHPRYYWKATPQQIAEVLGPIIAQPVDKLTTKLAEPYFTAIDFRRHAERLEATNARVIDLLAMRTGHCREAFASEL